MAGFFLVKNYASHDIGRPLVGWTNLEYRLVSPYQIINALGSP